VNTVSASVPVLRWAAQRANISDNDLSQRFRKWRLWLSGDALPTLRQLEEFARVTHTPIGYFFLPEPPKLTLPIPDFRALRDEIPTEPSPELLDTLYLCQQRQDWYREYARLHGLQPPIFVGDANLRKAPESVAQNMRETMGLSVSERRKLPAWTDVLRQMIVKAEDSGVLVMGSSIVGSNSHRKLNVAEFRGFALADDLAPLVFLNTSDSKAAQMFTLAHELAHIWLGATGISDVATGAVPKHQIEQWCNRVAAELLMPLSEVRAAYKPDVLLNEEIQRLAGYFKVSTLVVLWRLFDAGFIDESSLWRHYRKEQERFKKLEQRGSGGGDFYLTLWARTGKRFARALVANTLEGQTLFQDAFRMLGVRKTSTFYSAARELEIMS